MGKNPSPSSTPTPASQAPRRGRSGHGRSTLADVAAVAGLSPMTVSRYLREPGLVGGASATRVAQALKRTGYIANKQAGLLASGALPSKTRLVAAIIPSMANSIFAESVQALSDGLQAGGLELMLACTNYQLEREAQQIAAVLAWSPAALVLTGRKHSAAAMKLIRAAQARGVPVLEMWDLDTRSSRFMQVGFNHKALGRQMAEYLLAGQPQRVAYVDSAVQEDFRAHERASGFVLACQKAGHRVDLLRAPAGEPMQAGRDALAKLRGTQPQMGTNKLALAFANDHLAAGALLHAQSLGLQVPAQLTLLGFGDFPIANQLGGGISTVRVPRYEIGRLAAHAVLQALSPPPGGGEAAATNNRWATPPQFVRRATG